jgi:hypothetical protein
MPSRHYHSSGTRGHTSCYTFDAWPVNALGNIFSRMPAGASKSRAPSVFRRAQPQSQLLGSANRIAGLKLAPATAK